MHNRHGFALPSILIASVVMLLVLVTAITSVVATRTALFDQYYNQLAKEAAESGIEFATGCINQDESISWSDSAPLRTNTNCAGVVQVTCPTNVRHVRCGVIDSPTLRTTFTVGAPVDDGHKREFTATGRVELLRSSNGQPWRAYDYEGRRAVIQTQDPEKARATQRFWYFGAGAGLDFGTSGTTATSIAASCGSTCTSGEGVTVATNRSGDLLFWTNGLTIWNRDGNVMLNSTGLNANNSTTQAAAFFPLNKSLTKYVVVTNNAEAGVGNEGALYYSIIDMALDGGRGGIVTTQKNLPLWGATTGYTSEALTAAPKADGSGFWVVAFRPGTTNLIVFEFNSTGVVGVPQEFSSGASISRMTTPWIGYGTLNFNRDYTKLVMMAENHCTGATTCANRTGLIRLVDFDTKTGTPTNRFLWNAGSTQMSAGLANSGYSADFSPSGDYIYSTTLYPGRLYRYKITGMTTSATIKASEEFIGMTNSATDPNVRQGSGQVLTAPNGKMYVANYGFGSISVINNPDAATTASMTLAQRQAAVGFVYNGVTLSSGTQSRYGLPQMVTTYTPKIIVY